MGKLRVFLASLLVVAALGFSTPVTKAAVYFVDNQAAYQASTALAGITLTTESFEGFPAQTVASLDTGPFVVAVANGMLDVADFVLPGTDGTKWLRVYTTEFPTTFTFDTPVNSFSVLVANVFTFSGGSLRVQLDGGTPYTFVSQGFGGERNLFFGVIDTASAFTTVSFLESMTQDENIVFDRVQFGAAPIPEPSTLIIWSLLGALGIGVTWWRRRTAA